MSVAAPAPGPVLQAYAAAPAAPAAQAAPARPGGGSSDNKYVNGFMLLCFLTIAVFGYFYYKYTSSLDNYVPPPKEQPRPNADSCTPGPKATKTTVNVVQPPDSYLSWMVTSAIAFVFALFAFIFTCVDFSKSRKRNYAIAANGQTVRIDASAPLAPSTQVYNVGHMWQEMTGNGASLHPAASAPAAPPTMFDPNASAPPPTHVAPVGYALPAPGMSM